MLCLTLYANAGFGQEAEGYTSGAVTVKPSLGLHFAENDNIYTTPETPTQSSIFIQSPGLAVEIEPGRHRFEFAYDGEIAQYAENNDDNYTDNALRAAAFFDLDARHKVDVSASLVDDHEDRGSGLSRSAAPGESGFPRRPDEFNDSLASILYRFGATDATGRIELGVAANDRSYENNRDRTSVFDRSERAATGAFYYRFRQGAYLLFDGQKKDIDYDEDRPGQPGRDGEQLRLRIGITWEPTGQTRGRISVGRVRKEFDDPARSTFSGISWQADVGWSPRSYSHFDFRTSREPVETLGDGDFMDSQLYRLTWRHEWSDLWETSFGFRIRDEDFVGTERKEEMTEWTIDLGYRIRRWLTIEAGAGWQSTEATQESLEYDQAIYRLGFRFAP